MLGSLSQTLVLTLAEWYALAIIIITISVLVSVNHTSIVKFCEPLTSKIRKWPGGWMIPLTLLVIVSFPPLVGHESASRIHQA